MEPVFERRFIHDSYACRAGKGVLAASERLTQAVFERRALAAGASVVHVNESGEPDSGGCAPRRVTRMVLPASGE
jgi:hypothetical protein